MYADAPGKASFSLHDTTIYAGNSVSMMCNYTSQSNGNPTVNKYFWYNESNMFHTGTNNSHLLHIDSVNQEGNYACELGNSPEAGDQKGEISDGQHLTVDGN